MTNVDNTVLYTGVTDDIERRVAEHKSHTLKGFTDRYNVTKCVYVEEYGNINDAIMREKQIKGWSRAKKFDLINTTNPVLKYFGEYGNPSGRLPRCARNDISALHGMKQAIASCNDISTSYTGKPNKKQNDDVVKYKVVNKRNYKGNEENVSGN
ncbi:MAG: GIY-YIG nuclease family protein [Clostridiales bacterium]|nr:GIY-YIG nuclease family protein [Clostridiales bacterium]